jgi:hypothetical protein
LVVSRIYVGRYFMKAQVKGFSLTFLPSTGLEPYLDTPANVSSWHGSPKFAEFKDIHFKPKYPEPTPDPSL